MKGRTQGVGPGDEYHKGFNKYQYHGPSRRSFTWEGPKAPPLQQVSGNPPPSSKAEASNRLLPAWLTPAAPKP